MMFNKELFEKKITILDQTIDKIFDKASIPTDFTGNIAIVSFNTPKVAARARKRFPKAKVYFIEESALKCLFGICGLYYNDEGDLIKMLKNLEQDGLYIIANVPYGAIGANITKKIIDAVDFIEYVNLLPANDYKRNKDKNLYSYQSDMEAINNGFADAAVTTHVARIHKTKVNSMTLDEFERSNYIDHQLDKYFAENSKQEDYKTADFNEAKNHTVDVNVSIIFGWRDGSHHHMPYSKTVPSYLWNKLKSINYLDIFKTSKNGSGANAFCAVLFNSQAERDNFSNFLYSTNGFKFIAKVFTAVNADMLGTWLVHNALPKVDWTRSWTVEEILADYGYDADEIKAVMDDLKNFKGMED